MDLMANRVYYISANVVIRDDPRFECPVLEHTAECPVDEINEALKHCRMKIVQQRQRIQRLYTLRRDNGEDSEEFTSNSI